MTAKTGVTAGLIGPFIRIDGKDKWHWIPQCPKYPKGKDVEVKLSTVKPDKHELCSFCFDLDGEENAA